MKRKDLTIPQKRALWIFVNKKYPLLHIHMLTINALRARRLITWELDKLTKKGKQLLNRYIEDKKIRYIFTE